MSELYKEYLKNQEEIIEPAKREDLPTVLSPLFPFIDSHIDYFLTTYTPEKGRYKGIEIESVKEGFEIIHKDFWPTYKELKVTEDLRYFKVLKGRSTDNREAWYFCSALKR